MRWIELEKLRRWYSATQQLQRWNKGALIVPSIAVAEGRKMPEYQAYVIGEDGHIQQRIDLVCADDGEAKERAKSLVGVHAIELWQGDHKLATFEPDPAERAQGWLNGELPHRSKAASSGGPSFDLAQTARISTHNHPGMLESDKRAGNKEAEPSRLDEARRIIEEYAASSAAR
ncbi:hypothetical protein N2603_36265 [Bradyrhizobium huanghuaihaiense]|uniref:hypothetical protein n=1 Tax=Bradyrhizobium huanghuaihaiense TaxID=990078 RepID=UPI0021AAA9ED|nr:hypothetical protein [Bradyrhizobium sp. CB3035]UWU75443.1 hypothetical protein N2603_36265 [Bradyrhizobium sp. CB3035]